LVQNTLPGGGPSEAEAMGAAAAKRAVIVPTAASSRRILHSCLGPGGPDDNGLRREGYCSRSTERRGELGEDRQVGMEPDALDSAHAERQ